MPKSKRDKKVSLTRTKKKGLDFKQMLVAGIRENIEKYERIFLFSVDNMRNIALKEVRAQWKKSRFFFGKSKLMALALGRTKESEQAENIHKLANAIRGQCGLLFTNEELNVVVEWFNSFRQPEYARSGFQTPKTVTLPEGPLMDFISSMEPELRKLGLPTVVKNGKVHLRHEHTVCKEGDILTPAQAQILKLIGECLAEFRVTLRCVWNKNGSFEYLNKNEDVEMAEVGDGNVSTSTSSVFLKTNRLKMPNSKEILLIGTSATLGGCNLKGILTKEKRRYCDGSMEAVFSLLKCLQHGKCSGTD